MSGGVVVLAPHPDDETLGAGGSLLAAARSGRPIHWVLVTEISETLGFARERVDERRREIERVAEEFGFTSVHELRLPTMRLDTLPRLDVVAAIGRVISATRPDTVLLPHRGDAHSDHAVVFECGLAATKVFRHPTVRSVLTMEIPSETNFGQPGTFVPRHYVDVSDFLERKLAIMEQYRGEMAAHPFPRSRDSLMALATLRGSECGVRYAEAFDVIRSSGAL
jgi:LmbE family N-acetylglucosaminyl deacetylase